MAMIWHTVGPRAIGGKTHLTKEDAQGQAFGS